MILSTNPPAIRSNLSLRETKQSHLAYAYAITGFPLLSGLARTFLFHQPGHNIIFFVIPLQAEIHKQYL